MDSTRRIAERGRPAYFNTPQAKVNQTTEAVVSVSEDRSVTDEQRDKVGGVAADRKASLNRFKELLNGRDLPTMTQLMGAQEDAEDSVARKALEKPELRGDTAQATTDRSKTGSETEKASTESGSESEKASSEETKEKSVSGQPLTKDEQREVEKLKQRDREVRNHEQAHVAAGGQYVRGGISYDYQRGPDGQNYAVGGHVNIDVSEAETPEATIVKMQQVKRAALAPAEPSGADRSVAAAAAQKEQRARMELLEERQEEIKESKSRVEKNGTTTTRDEASAQGVEASSSPSESRAPEIEAPERPKGRDHMNLAREARMRIKRGESWMA